MSSIGWPRHDGTYMWESCIFRVRPIATLSNSPFTGSSKGIKNGSVWIATLSFNNKSPGETQELQAFLDRLEGPANPVRLYDPLRIYPKKLAASNTSAGAQTFSDGTLFDDGYGWSESQHDISIKTSATKGAEEITIKNMPNSTEFFTRGDLLEINGFLYEAINDLKSDSSGDGTLRILPRLRQDIYAGDYVKIYCPTGLFRMSENSGAISKDLVKGNPFTIDLFEDVP